MMGEKRFAFNVNKYQFEKDEEYFAHLDVVDVHKIVDKLNELSEEKKYFERKKEYFLSEWSIANAKNIQLRQKTKELEEENEVLKKKLKSLQKILHIVECCDEDE